MYDSEAKQGAFIGGSSLGFVPSAEAMRKQQKACEVAERQAMRQSANETRSMGQVAVALVELDKLLTALGDEIGGLGDRMGALLRPSMPEPAREGEDRATQPPSPVRSPLADGLTEANRRLYAHVLRVRDLATRADL